MIAKLFNMIKRAVVSNPGKDDGEFPITQVTYLGKVSDIEAIFPYGMAANLPKDSLVLMFNILGQEENKAGIGYRHDLRPKNLKEGEVVFGNFLAGTQFLFDADGNIIGTGDIQHTGDMELTGNLDMTGDATITGDVDIIGDLDITGNVTISGTLTVAGKDFTTHTHPITSGSSAPGPTGPVT